MRNITYKRPLPRSFEIAINESNSIAQNRITLDFNTDMSAVFLHRPVHNSLGAFKKTRLCWATPEEILFLAGSIAEEDTIKNELALSHEEAEVIATLLILSLSFVRPEKAQEVGHA